MANNLDPYLEHIRRYDPSLDLTVLRVDPNGLNNLVIIAGGKVFRFPRSQTSRANLRAESDLLAVAGRHLTTATPQFTFSDDDEMVVYTLIPGRPTYRHDLLRLPVSVQEHFAADVGSFLKELHAIPAEALATVDLAVVQLTAAGWHGRLDTIRRDLYPYLWADQQGWIEDLFAPVIDDRLDMTAYEPCLIHNDLATYHLLSDPSSGELCGVLDFGSAQWGDPAADIATLISAYGESFLKFMTATYPLAADLLERARVLAGYLELEWALKGLAGREPEWYLVHLGRARDMRPFGVSL